MNLIVCRTPPRDHRYPSTMLAPGSRTSLAYSPVKSTEYCWSVHYVCVHYLLFTFIRHRITLGLALLLNALRRWCWWWSCKTVITHLVFLPLPRKASCTLQHYSPLLLILLIEPLWNYQQTRARRFLTFQTKLPGLVLVEWNITHWILLWLLFRWPRSLAYHDGSTEQSPEGIGFVWVISHIYYEIVLWTLHLECHRVILVLRGKTK